MKPETKLWLRKRLLMILRAIVWRADEWLHRQELQLREEIDGIQKSTTAHQRVETPEITCRPAKGSQGATRRAPHHETFQLWEARRSGVAPVAKKPACAGRSRRRGLSAAEFDLRFAR